MYFRENTIYNESHTNFLFMTHQHPLPLKLRSRNILWLFVAIVFVSLLAWFTNSFSPQTNTVIIIFFLILAGGVFSLFMYLLKNTRRSFFITVAFLVFLLLRYLHLREYLYILLLVATIISLELVYRKR